MLLEVIGDKPVSELKQADINNFFDLAQALPPQWKNISKQKKITTQELASIKHNITLNPKSFNSYLACVRVFLKDSIKNWQDEGFPPHLTTDGPKYNGDRKAGENNGKEC